MYLNDYIMYIIYTYVYVCIIHITVCTDVHRIHVCVYVYNTDNITVYNHTLVYVSVCVIGEFQTHKKACRPP